MQWLLLRYGVLAARAGNSRRGRMQSRRKILTRYSPTPPENNFSVMEFYSSAESIISPADLENVTGRRSHRCSVLAAAGKYNGTSDFTTFVLTLNHLQHS